MEDDDALITSYRCHAWAYFLGSPIVDILCELTGTTLLNKKKKHLNKIKEKKR